MHKRKERGLSNAVSAGTIIILIIIAAVGFGLYATSPRSTGVISASTVTMTVTASPSSAGGGTASSSAARTAGTATNSSSSTKPGISGGFLNSKVVTFLYYSNTPYQCAPPTGQLFSNQTAAAAKAECEVGVAGKFPNNALPVWVSVPTYAGLSIFGVPKLGASPDGYPIYKNQTILTDCGAGGTNTSCPDHPTFAYSPAFTTVEKYLNMTTGYGGLPEGVLPTPAHSHIVDTDAGGQNIPWDSIAVLVFDPNIMPDAATGRCTQTVPSSLSNATANCLSSIAALQKAMTTNDTAIPEANAGNPIWAALGKPITQVVIPGVTVVSEIRNPNSNLDIYFAVQDTNPYPPLPLPSSSSQQQTATV